MNKFSLTLFAAVAASVTFIACTKSTPAPGPSVDSKSTTPAAPVAVNAPAPDASAMDMYLKTVYFEYDSSTISKDAQSELKKIASSLKDHKKVKIQIEGHCDERGSPEYNLALGSRRAQAIYEFLVTEGVSGELLTTISKGKEFPAAQGAGEGIWAKNRRGEFVKVQ